MKTVSIAIIALLATACSTNDAIKAQLDKATARAETAEAENARLVKENARYSDDATTCAKTLVKVQATEDAMVAEIKSVWAHATNPNEHHFDGAFKAVDTVEDAIKSQASATADALKQWARDHNF